MKDEKKIAIQTNALNRSNDGYHACALISELPSNIINIPCSVKYP